MQTPKITEPDHDFEVRHIKGKELVGKYYFTAAISFLFCSKGGANITINSLQHQFTENTNFLLLDALHFKVLDCSEDCEFIIYHFSIQFLNEVYPSLDNNVMEVIQYSAPDLYSEEELKSTNLTLQKLNLLNENKDHAYRHKLAVSLVSIYIYEIFEITRRHFSVNTTPISNIINSTIDRFFTLCSEHHMEHHNIPFYANKLNISSRYLHRIIKEAFSITPKQMIDYYIVGTAKKLLLTTILTNQQIADKLHFPDQSSFGQFFKRNVGMSPSEFRNTYK